MSVLFIYLLCTMIIIRLFIDGKPVVSKPTSNLASISFRQNLLDKFNKNNYGFYHETLSAYPSSYYQLSITDSSIYPDGSTYLFSSNGLTLFTLKDTDIHYNDISSFSQSLEFCRYFKIYDPEKQSITQCFTYLKKSDKCFPNSNTPIQSLAASCLYFADENIIDYNNNYCYEIYSGTNLNDMSLVSAPFCANPIQTSHLIHERYLNYNIDHPIKILLLESKKSTYYTKMFRTINTENENETFLLLKQVDDPELLCISNIQPQINTHAILQNNIQETTQDNMQSNKLLYSKSHNCRLIIVPSNNYRGVLSSGSQSADWKQINPYEEMEKNMIENLINNPNDLEYIIQNTVVTQRFMRRNKTEETTKNLRGDLSIPLIPSKFDFRGIFSKNIIYSALYSVSNTDVLLLVEYQTTYADIQYISTDSQNEMLTTFGKNRVLLHFINYLNGNIYYPSYEILDVSDISILQNKQFDLFNAYIRRKGFPLTQFIFDISNGRYASQILLEGSTEEESDAFGV